MFVYNGHFEIPLAAALQHVSKAGWLLGAKNPSAALSEARQAETLAPDSAAVNDIQAQALEASGQPDDADRYCQKALTIAESVEPGFQEARIWRAGKTAQSWQTEAVSRGGNSEMPIEPADRKDG